MSDVRHKIQPSKNFWIQTIWREGTVKPKLWKFDIWSFDGYLAFDFFVGKSLFTIGFCKEKPND